MKFTDFYSTYPQQAQELRALAANQSGLLSNDGYYQLLFNLAQSIKSTAELNQPSGTPLVVSIAGAQGSGKSTLARELAQLLQLGMSLSTAVISLDDFYLTRAERLKLAETQHPLLATRGVPGTHDIDWMQDVIESVRQGQSVNCPIFSKARDDRLPDTRVLNNVEVLLCEGWCWGVRPEPASRLIEPVNALEQREDTHGHWRGYVNRALEAYQAAFQADGSIFLKVPSMAAVLRWRWQQEQELERSALGEDRSMSFEEIKGFVSFYERLTIWMLEDQSHWADVTVPLSESHEIGVVTF